MGRAVYVLSNGELRQEGNTLVLVSESGAKTRFPIESVEEVYMLGEGSVTKKALQLLSKYRAPLHFFSYNGQYVGTFYPREHLNSGYVLLQQVKHYMDELKRLELALAFVEGAYHNSRVVISYYVRRASDERVKSELRDILAAMDKAYNSLSSSKEITNVSKLMGFEAEIKRTYYSAFDLILSQEGMEFVSRTRRPPSNEVNALLSFLNHLLYSVVLNEIYMTHLDPRIGFLHETNFRAFSLNLDVSEVFKPVIVDRLLFSLINKRIIRPEHFREETGGIALTDEGLSLVIRQWEGKMRETITIGNSKVSYRRLIRKELYKIERHLMGDEAYTPYKMR